VLKVTFGRQVFFFLQEPRQNLFGGLGTTLYFTTVETRCAFALLEFAIHSLDIVAALSESHMRSSML